MLIFRLDAPLFFANAIIMRDRLRRLVLGADPPFKVIHLDLEANSEFDLEFADTLAELREGLDREGSELWLARVHAPVREMLDRTNLTDRIGQEKILPSVHAGVEAYQQRVSPTGGSP